MKNKNKNKVKLCVELMYIPTTLSEENNLDLLSKFYYVFSEIGIKNIKKQKDIKVNGGII